MILSSIYSKLSKENKERFVLWLPFGFFFGLISGVIFGVVNGLFFGLIFGFFFVLLFGLIFGLLFGLFFGLFFGLAVILCNFTEAFPFINGFYPILYLIIGIFLLVELFYWLSPKEKVKKKDILVHTLKRKGEALFEVLMLLSAIAQIYILVRECSKYFNKEMLQFILMLIGYVGLGTICIIVIIFIGYLFIKLNNLKYIR